MRHAFAPESVLPGLATIESVRWGAPHLMAAQTSAVAAPHIYATGEEVLPLGGYTGTHPPPSRLAVWTMVDDGRFHLELVASPFAAASAAFVATGALGRRNGRRQARAASEARPR